MRLSIFAGVFVALFAMMSFEGTASDLGTKGIATQDQSVSLGTISLVDFAPLVEPSAKAKLPYSPAIKVAQCCKICRTGKACGNSCISKNYECHQPPGCACDG